MKTLLRLILALVIWPAMARAQFETLLVPPSEPVQAGQTMEVTLYLNNPTKLPATFLVPGQYFGEHCQRE